MKNYLKNNLVNIAALLFIINAISAFSVIVFLIAWEVLAIIWIVLAVVITLLLLVSCALSMRNKAKNEENDADCEYYPQNHKFYEKISADVWSWIFASTSKILKIFKGAKEKPRVAYHNETTDNHSLHSDTLTQEQPNANKTLYFIY